MHRPHLVESLNAPLPQRRPLRRDDRQRGFTLIELLVAVSVIVILLALAFPAFRSLRSSSAMTAELAAARQLMTGFAAYTEDNRGAVMPGYLFPNPPPAKDEAGNPISNPVARARYPWRLAPYLNYDLRGLYLDDFVLSQIENQDLSTYLISLYPSLGMNTTFVGGDSEGASGIPAGFNAGSLQTYGNFYITRASQPRKPAELIVFASARSDIQFAPGSPPEIQGYYRVLPPYGITRLWDAQYSEDAPPNHFGFVSLRHMHRRAVTGMFDGSVRSFDDGRIQDMRLWSDRANRPDWTLQPE